MRHTFPYREVEPVDIPDRQLAGVYSIGDDSSAFRDPKELVIAALANPVGSPPLRARVGPGSKVLIVTDDNTRTTRTEVMLPAVIAELLDAGLSEDDIEVFVALGTHRPMTRAEMELKYTPALVARHPFTVPDVHNPAEYGKISGPRDFEIRIHRRLIRADFIIGVGQTVPHLIAGFGGGCKIVNPGCADPGTIGRMHWLCSTVPEGQLFAVRDNAVRARIDEVGLKAGMKFIVNEVPGKDDAVAAVFAGDPIAAHREACAFAGAACAVKVAELADIVVADACPCDFDFWQSLKGLNAACSAVRRGGTVVFVTPCPEGVCAQHPELLSVGLKRSDREIEGLVGDGKLDPIVGAAIWLGSRLAERAHITVVSAGMSKDEAVAMGLDHASTPAAALAKALDRHGPSARVNVLYKAAKMICEK
ncbi:nickel-dependent lactate racemase [Verrucomicrobiota bacterium]